MAGVLSTGIRSGATRVGIATPTGGRWHPQSVLRVLGRLGLPALDILRGGRALQRALALSCRSQEMKDFFKSTRPGLPPGKDLITVGAVPVGHTGGFLRYKRARARL
jgi:hypothetical protein